MGKILNRYHLYKKGWFSLALGFILFFALPQSKAQGLAQDLNFQASIDTQEIKVGEQFHFILQAVTDSDGATFSWAHVPDTFSHLMVVQQSAIDTIREKNKTIYQKRYTLTGFDSGRWVIPSFQFFPHGITDSAALDAYRTNAIPVLVHSVKVDTTKPFKPITEIREVPFNILDYWVYILIGLIIVLVVLYFIFFYKKKNKPKKVKEIPQEPPYDQAVKNLQSLEQEKLWEKGEIKAYYSELTGILRLYIYRAYQVNALEQTSDELLAAIKKRTRLNQQREPLRYILEMADLAKFAKLSPSPEEHQNCLKKAKDFVEWTKPIPKEEDDESKNKKKNK